MMSSKRDWRTQPSGPNKPVSVNPQGSATKIFLSTFLPRAQKKFEIPSLKISEVLDFKLFVFLIEIQLFISIFSWKFSCLFTFSFEILGVCLHFQLKFQLFVYISIESLAVCLHFQLEIQLFVYIFSWKFSCLFTFLYVIKWYQVGANRKILIDLNKMSNPDFRNLIYKICLEYLTLKILFCLIKSWDLS